ncbi:MAG: serine hydrolase domain-containing protein, partial [Maribacter sp.]
MKLKTIVFLIFLFLSSKHYTQELKTIALKDSLEQLLLKKKIPGAFIAVVSKDSILFQETFGKANLEDNSAVNKEHLFRIASITKTFTAMAIMKLVEEGKLSLEDELRKIAPEISFTNEWEKTHPVRIKHLLEHKAGFEDLHFSHLVIKNQSEFADTTLEGIALYEKSLKCAWKPGLVTSYSNPGYLILAHLIENASGMSHQAYITTAILEPLQIVNTRFSKTLLKTDLVSKGYMYIENEIEPAEVRDYKIVETASGLLSNADDMVRLLQFFLNENLQDSLNVISKKSVLEIETLHGDLERSNNIQMGYSLGLEDRVFGDEHLLFKGNSGLTDGFTTNIIYSRDHNLGIAMSANLFGVGHRDMLNLLVNEFT